jgi:hypothetical protein
VRASQMAVRMARWGFVGAAWRWRIQWHLYAAVSLNKKQQRGRETTSQDLAGWGRRVEVEFAVLEGVDGDEEGYFVVDCVGEVEVTEVGNEGFGGFDGGEALGVEGD